MGKQLIRLRQIAAKIESAEGTAETLAAADARLYVMTPKFQPNVERFDRNPARSSLTHLQGLAGKRTGKITFELELRGSGTAATAPQWSKLLRMCGMQEVDPWDITHGGITGTFQKGERVTQATSGATGILAFVDATKMWLIPLTGTFDGTNTITGDDSAATVTASAAAQGTAVLWRPLSGSTVPSGTFGGYFDGVKHVVRGARGSFSLAGAAGEAMKFAFEFDGVLDPTTDVALLTGISHETTVPPVFLGTSMTLDAYSAIFTTVDLNIQNEVVERVNAGDAAGVLSFLITGRSPQFTCDPEMELVATHDFFGKLRTGTPVEMDLGLGSVAGNRFKIGIPAAQQSQLSDDDRNSIAVAGSTYDVVGKDIDGEDDFFILHY